MLLWETNVSERLIAVLDSGVANGLVQGVLRDSQKIACRRGSNVDVN